MATILLFIKFLMLAIVVDGVKTQRCRFGNSDECEFPCHCKNGAVCDADTGDCENGCDDGEKNSEFKSGEWYGPGCQIGNVAYKKSAKQRTVWKKNMAKSAPENAVDGDTNQNFPDGKCSYQNETPVWWQVDLGDQHLIYNITIYNRKKCCEERIYGISIQIGNTSSLSQDTECSFIEKNDKDYDWSKAIITKQCSHPTLGQFVTLSNMQYTENMAICEVYVWGFNVRECPVGFWGPGCLERCHCKTPCNYVTQSCTTKCLSGWIGKTCQFALPNLTSVNVYMKNRSLTSLSISFMHNPPTYEKQASYFIVQYRPSKTGEWINYTVTEESQHATVYNLHPGTSYVLQVLPVYSDGTVKFDGQPTPQVTLETEEIPSLEVFSSLENTTNTSISLSFMPVMNLQGYTKQPSYYVIQYRLSGGDDWIQYTNVSYPHQDRTFRVTIDNLEPDTSYELQVQSIYIDGTNHIKGQPALMKTFQTEGFHKMDGTDTNPLQSNLVAIGGGAAAVFVVLLLILVVAILVIKRKKKQKPEKPDKQEPVHASINERPLYANIGNFVASSVVPSSVVETEDNEPINKDKKAEDIVLSSEIVPTTNNLDGATQPKVEKGSINAAYEDYGEGEHEPLYQNMQAHPEYNIPVEELTAYIQSTRNKFKGFEPEYKFLPEGALASWDTGETKINKSKNRFKNFSAYDHSRVVLTIQGDKKSTDYINGSFIKGYPMKPKAYIAVQGPREWTVNDMWRLIFQENVNLVIMVTNLVEAGKEKCSRYWPESGHKTYGDITVELSEEEVFADFVIRTLKVDRKDTSRKVHHYHFTSWPDHGVPSTSTAFLEFHHRVQSFLPSATGPMLVHCSAGIGRTGTFIAIDYLLKQAETEDLVNVFDCVNKMRADRYNMVQTQDQYEFIYDTLLEALRSGNTAIPSYSFSETFKQMQKNDPKTCKNKLQDQFEVLDALKSVPSKEDIDALDEPNLAKNRNLDIYPENGVRPYLLFKVPGCNDYINAAYINGYKVRSAYIVTQSPLPNTVNDIWRLALDHRCHTIIALNETGHIENIPQYWPNKDEDWKVGAMNIKLVKEDSSELFTMREFSLTQKNKKPHTVRQIQADWEEEDSVPCSASLLLNILEKVEEWSKLSGQGPIIVHCVDGAKHSGLVVAAMYLLDKMKVDQEVNVFHTVKYIRTNRPQLITSLDQYIFLHQIAQSCMDKYDTYANFKKI